MTVIGGVLIYLSLASVLAGIISLLKPLRWLGIRTRLRGLGAVGVGVLGFAAGAFLPVIETRVDHPCARLDEFVPAYQFNERHRIRISASKERVWAAIYEVTPEEIRFYKALTWIRRFGRSSPPGALNPPDHQPILGMFTKGTFHVLSDEPERELVFGMAGTGRRHFATTPAEFKTLEGSPLAKIAMNFRIEDADAGHCALTTETRIYVAGFNVLHGFAGYWRMIYPGSSLIRYEWLRAIKRRAEAAPAANISGL